MAISLPEVVKYACHTAAGRSYMANPDEATRFGRNFLDLIGADKAQEYHQAILAVRDQSPSAVRLFGWAKDEAEQRALTEAPGIVLHMGITWGLLADSAPRDYWPSDQPVPDDLDRDLWSELLYWAYALANDEGRVAEWHLCVAAGGAPVPRRRW